MGHRRFTGLGRAVIIDGVECAERSGLLERSATVRWAGGEFRLGVAAPPALADESPDASGFLAVALPLAMRLGEDVRVEGPVSPELFERTDEIQACYAAWAPFVRRVRVHAELAAIELPVDDRNVMGFFSRGVDSVFMAARDRATKRRLDALVFGDGLEPLHDPATRAAELRRAQLQCRRIGLPLEIMETNVRGLTGPIVRDWEDMCGAGLAFVAHALAGGVSAVHIAATDSFESIEPAGTSPLLDPMFSTERLEIVHDTIAFTRLDKIRWLVEHCPDTIDDLKVCYEENRPDNCGRCGKCMITMACLEVCGALEQSTQFPHELDFDAIAGQRLTVPKALIDWAELARLDDDNCGGRLRSAVRTALHRSVKTGHAFETIDGPLWIEPRSFRTHRMNLLLELLFDGEPYPDIAPPSRLERVKRRFSRK
jgi:7-cyano-7-deazaguanine synthase in queuosine biosynthesis